MSDDVVWQLIKDDFCAYRKWLNWRSTDTTSFCTNAYNVTGLCNRGSCPLANSNYATVIEDQGSLYLCMKTAERCHTPREQWERLKLSKNLKESLSQINEATKVGIAAYLTQKCRLRLKRWREVLQRMRREALSQKTKVAPIKRKTERREAIRERKAEIAARLDNAIEQELLNPKRMQRCRVLTAADHEVCFSANAPRMHMEIEYDEDFARDVAQ
ncbi:Mak16 family protein, putative [Babesia bigemina]|uniref:Mak16 family protein, putative n=1 Tax=Babesia bigemina TaxID=5866 RepID=A0A061DDL8_BABBI|nr:Mak16 family protein, putative [Babesia bigemina]CDR96365.1 Mak16 family protein, putative [Babesia bigemina]|eukprot:XP_012768551.1 Mak16 family protein, putative [Babesia bigemina]